ncbi:BnaA03g00190D [Brassica napus]|uniref:BnaA03g00190D protein n=1 Tax=Brassica napus TaxID=3708 RepID=A0A078FGK3_BRANA|nr:BnaA03g00190D [Brassica napus]
METSRSLLLRKMMVRVLLMGVLVILVRFAYVVTITGESCNRGDFCFFSLPQNLNLVISGGSSPIRSTSSSSSSGHDDLYTSRDWIQSVRFYSSIFQDLISDGYLSPESNTLCVETATGQDVFALREIGVKNSIGISKKAFRPLVVRGEGHAIPFQKNTFDFVFSGGGRLGKSLKQLEFAEEITRTLKPRGIAVVHVGATDTYSFNSFLDLFNSCSLVKMRDLDGFDSSMPHVREFVIQKVEHNSGGGGGKCWIPGYKRDLIRDAEPLIPEEPLKPWITLKRNIQNVKYIPSMVDIRFKSRYVYVDVGARSYGSSIGSWFKKQYPKQNKTFDVFAIEADKAFHDEYKIKKKVQLLPYAAWVRNETLSFEINHDPGKQVEAKAMGRGMGRIQPVTKYSSSLAGEVNLIQGFDFADWLKKSVRERDFVVMKMDVEGTEFDLIPRLIKTGAICLIDELFLECHYNRWQRCCPGQRSQKYNKTYNQCLELFTSLRQSGVLVHQWW